MGIGFTTEGVESAEIRELGARIVAGRRPLRAWLSSCVTLVLLERLCYNLEVFGTACGRWFFGLWNDEKVLVFRYYPGVEQ